MNLAALTDDSLQDIFLHVNYTRQCLLRRCCQRWNRVLRTRYVLRNMVYLTTTVGYANCLWAPRQRESIVKDIPFVENVYFITPSPPSTADWDDNHFRELLENLRDFRDSIAGRRQLYLQNIHRMRFRLLEDIMRAFDRVECRNVGFCFSVDSWLLRLMYPSEVTLFEYLWDCCAVIVYVPGPYGVEWTLDGGDEDQSQLGLILRKVLQDNMAHVPVLAKEDMLALTDRLALPNMDHGKLSDAMKKLLAVFQPDYVLRPDADLTTLDYGQFSPFVCALLLNVHLDSNNDRWNVLNA